MLQLIRYLQGYLAIKVVGFSPERFMNLCSNHHLFLWDIVNHGDYYTMNISLKNFYKLKGFTRKTGTRVVITQRYGLPFLSVRMWRRKIFIAGLVGSLLFWLWMAGFIWAVEVEGNFFITTDMFQDFLVENGIRTGMNKKEVDIEKLEEAIRTKFDIVTWTSAKIEGTKLLIQVRENDLIQMEAGNADAAETEQGMDLTANKDGVVVSMVTRSGVPLVHIGDEVKKGDILVEGAVPIYQDDGTVKRYEYCVADADIMLQCFIIFGTKEIKMPLLGKKFDQCDMIEEKKQLKIFRNYYLPVYIGSNQYREYKVEEQIYTKEQVKVLFEEKLQKFIETLQEKGVQIVEKNVTIKKASGKWKMNADFLAQELTGQNTKTGIMQIEIPQQEEVPEEDGT